MVETEVTGLLTVGVVMLRIDAFDGASCGEAAAGLGNGCVSYEQLSDTKYYHLSEINENALTAAGVTSASSSNVSGSGTGPSIAQRLLSYLLRMKLSILLGNVSMVNR